jgi:hypothetical protein
MTYDRDYMSRQSDEVLRNLVSDSPHWLQAAVQQKNPRLSLALADSILLVYDDLDKKLMALTGLN